MYEKYLNENNIWKTQHYGFPVAKSTTTDPDLERAVKIDQTIKDEETARINEDIRINARIDKEIEDRIAAVENETSLRASADDVLKNYIYDIFSIKYRNNFTFKSRTEYHPLWNYTASEKCVVMVYLSVGTNTAQNSVNAAIGIGDVKTDARSNILINSQSLSDATGNWAYAAVNYIATLNVGQHITLYSSSILANTDINCLISANVINN